MPAIPVAFCSVHSKVMVGRTSFPFLAQTVTERHALPPAGRAAAASCTLLPPAKALLCAGAAANDMRSAFIGLSTARVAL